MCWAHMKKNIQTKLQSKQYLPRKSYPKEEGKKNAKVQKYKAFFEKDTFDILKVLQTDILILRDCPTKKHFDIYFKIIEPFWRDFAPGFLKFFVDTYVKARSGWQNYLKKSNPATNNALEACNRGIKELVTNYEKLNLGVFLAKLFEDLSFNSGKSADFQYPAVPDIAQKIWAITSLLFDNFAELMEEENEENSTIYYIIDLTFKESIFRKGKISTKNLTLANSKHFFIPNSVN